ncbi:uncharacterized protein METZ01_LOCUS416458, partial [marine metagenome]
MASQYVCDHGRKLLLQKLAEVSPYPSVDLWRTYSITCHRPARHTAIRFRTVPRPDEKVHDLSSPVSKHHSHA